MKKSKEKYIGGFEKKTEETNEVIILSKIE